MTSIVFNNGRRPHFLRKRKTTSSLGKSKTTYFFFYQFNGKVFKQQKGGPIGLEITGVLARLVMLWWDRTFVDKLRMLEIDLLMYLRYVDDRNLSLEAVEPGLTFKDGKLFILQEEVEADRDIPADKRTANCIKTVANTISFMIIMEEECPSNHPSGKMPILDLEV
jgi:hypothetical protein